MNTIIQNKNKNKTNFPEIGLVKPCDYKFIMFLLDYTAHLAVELKKQGINYSIATLYDIAPLLRLIYSSLLKTNSSFEKGASFVIDCKEFQKIIYQGEDNLDNSKCSKNFYKILHLINEIDFSFPDIKNKKEAAKAKNKLNKKIIYFNLDKSRKCEVVITSDFSKYVTKYILPQTGNCIKIFKNCRKYLSQIRKSQRAYAYFIENLFFLSEYFLKHNLPLVETRRKETERIRALFAKDEVYKKGKDNSKHQFSFSEIKKYAEESLNKHHIDNLIFLNILNEIFNEKNTKGISPKQLYDNGEKLISDVKEAKRLGKTEEEISAVINNYRTSIDTKIICRKIANKELYGEEYAS